jgi:hypothetical protein
MSITPEARDPGRTTTHAEVEALVDCALRRDRRLRRVDFGRSTEGRSLFAVLAADPPCEDLAAARARGRPAVLLLANIHGGEVDAKEAAIGLLHGIAAGRHEAWLQSLIVAIVPDLNPDGNDAISLDSRPEQAGPPLAGRRTNGQDLDINRDFVKLESPEARGVVRLLRDLDPVLVIDGHTTDGTYHGYDLTFAGPLSPATDPEILGWTRESFLPGVQARARKAGIETFDYGNLEGTDAETGLPQWVSFDPRPRFLTNHIGLRNRPAFLSESYAHAPFLARIRSSRLVFIAVLDEATARRSELVALVEAADARARAGLPALPRGRRLVAGETIELLLGSVAERQDPVTGACWLEDTGERSRIAVRARVHFEAEELVPLPRAYALLPEAAAAARILDLHGVESVPAPPGELDAEFFLVTAVHRSAKPFQGARETRVEGRWEGRRCALPDGTILVPVAQRLGRLAAHLLDPRHDDGLLTWEKLPPAEVGSFLPVLRILGDPRPTQSAR